MSFNGYWKLIVDRAEIFWGSSWATIFPSPGVDAEGGKGELIAVFGTVAAQLLISTNCKWIYISKKKKSTVVSKKMRIRLNSILQAELLTYILLLRGENGHGQSKCSPTLHIELVPFGNITNEGAFNTNPSVHTSATLKSILTSNFHVATKWINDCSSAASHGYLQ